MVKKKKHKGRPNVTGLSGHRRSGKELTPPLANYRPLQLKSWIDDRLPDILWAVLIVGQLDREHALHVFRRAADHIFKLTGQSKFHDITHTGLAKLPRAQLNAFLGDLIFDNVIRQAFGPLILLRELPAYESWVSAIGSVIETARWEPMMQSVARCFDHQSQEATDCRWLKVLCRVLAGKFHLGSDEGYREVTEYPTFGDMRRVRSSIRASELALEGLEGNLRAWPQQFWQFCLSSTGCFPLGLHVQSQSERPSTIHTVERTYSDLRKHCLASITTTAVDARFDTVFGLAFYSLGILRELFRVGNGISILGRVGLRSIMECYITGCYLLAKDDSKLWESYRVFGAGQAKLSYLKFIDEQVPPPYIDMQLLEMLASEDRWLEYQPINLGHWEKSNLRSLSEKAGVKHIYDRYYSWTSTYVHGHWGAVRDATFDKCGNPLHRLHRIPLDSPRDLPDVVPDACELVDALIGLVDQAYPEFKVRLCCAADQT